MDIINALVNVLGIDVEAAQSIAGGQEPVAPAEWLRVADYLGVEDLPGLRVRLTVRGDELRVLAGFNGVGAEEMLRR